MVEKQYRFTKTDEKVIEKIIDDKNVAVNHMVLNTGEALPEHVSNSNVYMIVVRGAVTLQLDNQPPHTYESGSIVTIPYKTNMNVRNEGIKTLEFFVVKAPGPSTMKG